MLQYTVFYDTKARDLVPLLLRSGRPSRGLRRGEGSGAGLPPRTGPGARRRVRCAGAGGAGGAGGPSGGGTAGVGVQLPSTFQNPMSAGSLGVTDPGDPTSHFWVAAGGGASSFGGTTGTAGGKGGGGAGSTGNTNQGIPGMCNTGSGGGGGGFQETHGNDNSEAPSSGSGGSGLVLIAYDTN